MIYTTDIIIRIHNTYMMIMIYATNIIIMKYTTHIIIMMCTTNIPMMTYTTIIIVRIDITPSECYISLHLILSARMPVETFIATIPHGGLRRFR